MSLDFIKLTDANNNVQDIANELDALVGAESDDLRNLILSQLASLKEKAEELYQEIEDGDYEETELQAAVVESN